MTVGGISVSRVEHQPRDIVVVGASAGGLEALTRLCARLPRDFSAAVAVVVHISPTWESALPSVLARATPLPVVAAANGVAFESRRVYVAIPDRHLLIVDGSVALRRDAKEHLHRPAIDPLFRSAAEAYGTRVVGVILSGAGSDGVLGAQAIRAAGGIVLAQDPSEARQSGMPRAAIARNAVDAVLSIERLARALVRLTTGEGFD